MSDSTKLHNACAEQSILRVQPRTQAFKDWDKMFSFQDLALERAKWLTPTTVGEKFFNMWPFKVDSWTHNQVRTAVYEADDAKNWQRFRVSLKGLSTQQKLYMLRARWDAHNSSSQSMIEKCRIDNYLGALIRGGQLNSNYEIVR